MCAKYKTLHKQLLVHVLDARKFVVVVVCCLYSMD